MKTDVAGNGSECIPYSRERRFPLRFLHLLMMLALAWGAVARGTETTGTIRGLVVDSTGAVVLGATVTVTNIATKETDTSKTDSQGQFVFSLLKPGSYQVVVEATGFDRYLNSQVDLIVGQVASLNIPLTVGAAQQTITVVASAPQVNTSNPQLGETEVAERTVTLPLIAGNVLQLTELQPGVTAPIVMTSAETPRNLPGGIGVSPNVNGLRYNANNYLLDGSDDNEPFLGVAAVIPSVESIEELNVITGLYPAEYGRSGGSVINIITKSGSNDFHGAAWDYLRNDFFNAANYFATAVNPFKRNEFGAILGGPIQKDKTFFFASYEGSRQSEGETQLTTVPSLANRAGDFSSLNPDPVTCSDPGAICDPTTGLPFPGNKIPTYRFDPAANLLLPLWPAPNVGVEGYVSQPALPESADQGSVRLDHDFSSKDHLWGRYFFQQGTSQVLFQPTFNGPVQVPGFPAEDYFRMQNLVIEEEHIFSQSLINEFRASYNRAHLIAGKNEATRLPSDYGFQFYPNDPKYFPNIGVSGYSVIGTSDFDNVNRFNNVYDFQDNVVIVKGRHTMKPGFEFLRARLNNFAPINQPFFTFLPTFTGNAFSDFLLGDSSVMVAGGGNSQRYYTSNRYSAYFEDSYKVSRKLSLELGLRYELLQPWSEENHLFTVFDPGHQSTVQPEMPPGVLFYGDPGVPNRASITIKTDFAPRIGIAWDPFGDGKTSVRTGFGIYYDAGDFNSERFQNLVSPGPNGFAYLDLFGANLSNPYPAFGYTPQGPFVPGAALNNTLLYPPLGSQLNVTDPNLHPAYVMQYSLSVERQIAPNYTFKIAYFGNQARKLVGTIDLNQPLLTPDATATNEEQRRPYQPWGVINYQFGGLNSNYNGLQLAMDKAMSHGLNFRAAYTWSHTIDFGSLAETFQQGSGQPVFPQNGRDLAAEKGNAAFDIRQRFVFSGIWDIPFFKGGSGWTHRALGNWALSGIVQWNTGLPLTVIDTSDTSLTGELSDRPDVVCNPNNFPHTVNEWFNTGCFVALGPLGGLNHNGYGDAGRNIVEGPGLSNTDFSIIKLFPLKERMNLEFRTEFFDLFNHPNFESPGNNITAPQTFGIIESTLPDSERQIQFLLKLNF
jgi:hypothetical protein